MRWRLSPPEPKGSRPAPERASLPSRGSPLWNKKTTAVKQALRDALNDRGYDTLTPVQEAVLDPDLTGVVDQNPCGAVRRAFGERGAAHLPRGPAARGAPRARAVSPPVDRRPRRLV